MGSAPDVFPKRMDFYGWLKRILLIEILRGCDFYMPKTSMSIRTYTLNNRCYRG